MSRLKKIYRNERGMVLIMAGLGCLAFLSAAMFAIDVGMLMVARTQAQGAADVGALAGAVALVFDDFNDRSAADQPGSLFSNCIAGRNRRQLVPAKH